MGVDDIKPCIRCEKDKNGTLPLGKRGGNICPECIRTLYYEVQYRHLLQGKAERKAREGND